MCVKIFHAKKEKKMSLRLELEAEPYRIQADVTGTDTKPELGCWRREGGDK